MKENPKYIVFEEIYSYPCVCDMPMIIFPAMIDHSLVAKMMKAKPISAGFVDIENGICYGISTSLDLKSNPERDSKLFQLQINGKDYFDLTL